ncbi:MAG: hypothetical protein IPL11_19535 [Candidatus Accumulibacter sp.]|nr:hypothetical protein [Accumulibacter sp.]
MRIDAALTSKTIEVRVLPDSAFGLIHGKAGVVRRADGSATAFLGSVNESASAWKLNYELLWEDSDPETIAWVQEEFDALWNDARAVDLACCPFIAQDVRRIMARKVIEPADIKAIADPIAVAAAAAVRNAGLSSRTRSLAAPEIFRPPGSGTAPAGGRASGSGRSGRFGENRSARHGRAPDGARRPRRWPDPGACPQAASSAVAG